MKYFAIVLTLLLASCSCQKPDDDGNIPVATVYDKVLYQSDLQNIVYEGISYSDSIVRTKAFIDRWIRQQLLLQQAEASYKKSEIDFSKQLESYRNSLIIYKYESEYVKKNLDTVVTERDIAKYIKDNDSTMALNKEAVRYIILNMRKKALLEKMNNSLYSKAVKDNSFVIY